MEAFCVQPNQAEHRKGFRLVANYGREIPKEGSACLSVMGEGLKGPILFVYYREEILEGLCLFAYWCSRECKSKQFSFPADKIDGF